MGRFDDHFQEDRGFADRTKGQRYRDQLRDKSKAMERKRKAFIEHIVETRKIFNQTASRNGIHVRMDISNLVRAIRAGYRDFEVELFDESPRGRLFPNQAVTVVETIAEMENNPGLNGIIKGTVQSGKTTIGAGLLFTGPIFFLLTEGSIRYYPLFLSTNHKGITAQTKDTIWRFLHFYGDIKFEDNNGESVSLLEYGGITLKDYEKNVLKRKRPEVYDDLTDEFLDDRLHRRSAHLIEPLSELIQRRINDGFSILAVLDEPQWASLAESVTDRIFTASGLKDGMLNSRSPHIFIGLSATPYQYTDLEQVWSVPGRLSPNYCGYNHYCGDILDDTVGEVKAPKHHSFSWVQKEYGLRYFSIMKWNAYYEQSSFDKLVDEVGCSISWDTYRRYFKENMRKLILRCVDVDQHICIRLVNHNTMTDDFIASLKLPSDITVLSYTGNTADDTIEDIVRSYPKGKLVIFVTGKARLGDAFPKEVKFFLELANKTGDMNALLQGLLGRACGHNKDTTVFLSDTNADVVDKWIHLKGSPPIRPHKTARRINSPKRSTSNILRFFAYYGVTDPAIRAFSKRMQDLVDELITSGSVGLKGSITTPEKYKGKKGQRVLPIFDIMHKVKVRGKKIDLFEHVKDEGVRKSMYRKMMGIPELVDENETIAHSSVKRGEVIQLGYDNDGIPGHCYCTFTDVSGQITSLADHDTVVKESLTRDARRDRAQQGDDRLAPQINVVRVDDNDQVIPPGDPRIGTWKFYMLSMRMKTSLTSIESDGKILPSGAWADAFRTDAEDAEVARLKTRRRKS